VVLIDDEPAVALMVRGFLGEGYSVTQFESLTEQSIEQVRQVAPDVVLLDLRMPGFSGTDAVRKFRDAEIPVPVVVVTSTHADEIAADCCRWGAFRVVNKAALRHELRPAIEEGLAYAAGRIEIDPIHALRVALDANTAVTAAHAEASGERHRELVEGQADLLGRINAERLASAPSTEDEPTQVVDRRGSVQRFSSWLAHKYDDLPRPAQWAITFALLSMLLGAAATAFYAVVSIVNVGLAHFGGEPVEVQTVDVAPLPENLTEGATDGED